MDPRRTIDFSRTADDFARWQAGFPDAFFERLEERGIGRPGQAVLDLATGTGSMARALALRGCRVTALDRSAALLEHAQRLDAEAAVAIRYVEAPAEETGLPEASFEVVTASQCWYWFDRARAAAEAWRVLAPGGALVLAHLDWVPLPGNMAETTDRLLSVYNPGLSVGDGSGLYPAWLRDLALAGFRDLETFSFDLAVRYSHEAWRGRVRASAPVGASLGPDEVLAFDRDLRRLLERKFADPIEVPHRAWALLGRRAPAG
jgi:SAM-dependent methyltransferase